MKKIIVKPDVAKMPEGHLAREHRKALKFLASKGIDGCKPVLPNLKDVEPAVDPKVTQLRRKAGT